MKTIAKVRTARFTCSKRNGGCGKRFTAPWYSSETGCPACIAKASAAEALAVVEERRADACIAMANAMRNTQTLDMLNAADQLWERREHGESRAEMLAFVVAVMS